MAFMSSDLNQVPDQNPAQKSISESIADLQPHVAAGLATLLPPFSGIVMLILDRARPTVKFYAIQSIVFGGCGFLIMAGLGILGGLAALPLIGGVFAVILSLLSVTFGLTYLTIYTITLVKAFTGTEWGIPYIGKFARTLIRK
jgi:uncharacterized membrane protein